jgi:hypothetical protein
MTDKKPDDAFRDANGDVHGNATPVPSLNGAAPPAPRWVRVLGIITGVIVVLFVIFHLAGGGFQNHMR